MSAKEPMLYRAPSGMGPPNRWESDHFIRLGTRAEVAALLAELLSGLTWREGTPAEHAVGTGRFRDNQVDVYLHLDADADAVIWIGMSNLAEPDLLRELNARFGLMAFDPESCRFLIPPDEGA